MDKLIVLGQIPGTNYHITFFGLSSFCATALISILFYVVLMRKKKTKASSYDAKAIRYLG